MALTVEQAGLAERAREEGQVEPTERIDLLMRDLRSSSHGLSAAEAHRRLLQHGPNELRRRGGPQWPRELARQLTHPLALLLWLAAALSFAVGSLTVAIAVLLVIALNAVFALIQEMPGGARRGGARAVPAPTREGPARRHAARDPRRRDRPRRCGAR